MLQTGSGQIEGKDYSVADRGAVSQRYLSTGTHPMAPDVACSKGGKGSRAAILLMGKECGDSDQPEVSRVELSVDPTAGDDGTHICFRT